MQIDSKDIRVSGKGCGNEVETMIGIFDDDCGISLLPLFSTIHSDIWFSNVV